MQSCWRQTATSHSLSPTPWASRFLWTRKTLWRKGLIQSRLESTGAGLLPPNKSFITRSTSLVQTTRLGALIPHSEGLLSQLMSTLVAFNSLLVTCHSCQVVPAASNHLAPTRLLSLPKHLLWNRHTFPGTSFHSARTKNCYSHHGRWKPQAFQPSGRPVMFLEVAS